MDASTCERLLSLSRDLASTLDLHRLLLRIVDAATELCQAEASSILLYDETSRELRFQVSSNLAESFYHSLVVPEDSLAGWVVRHRQAVRVEDVQNDPRHYALEVPNFTPRNLIAVPLLIKDRVLGALEVLNKRTGTFTEEDERLLSILSAQAAVAIENARLFQQSDLIAELIHELRTPLNAILAAAHLLQRVELSDAMRRNLAETLLKEAEHLNNLLASFLDMAKLDSGRITFQPTTFRLDKLLRECEQLLQPLLYERRIRFEQIWPDEPVTLTGDRSWLKQALLNLLSNAVKYNNPGGTVEVRVETNSQDVWVHIRDTGPGIAPEYLPHLFDRFYRVPGSERVASGTGLGLYLSRRIIEAHGGEILVQSQLDRGSVFSVRLPRQPRWTD